MNGPMNFQNPRVAYDRVDYRYYVASHPQTLQDEANRKALAARELVDFAKQGEVRTVGKYEEIDA